MFIGLGLTALIAIASFVAFNLGAQSNGDTFVTTEDATADVGGSAAAAKQSIEGQNANVESAGLDVLDKPDTEGVTSTTHGSDPNADGISVHGRWTIDVSEPDGKLVSHSEFENALISQGQQSLVAFLGGDSGVGRWNIYLQPTIGETGACETTSGTSNPCQIHEISSSAAKVNNLNIFGDLQVESSLAFPPSVTISGSATAAYDSTITQVSSFVERCDPTISASNVTDINCGPISHPFTAKELDSPVAVLPNQVINVTLVLTFS